MRRILIMKTGATDPDVIRSHGDYDRWFTDAISSVDGLDFRTIELTRDVRSDPLFEGIPPRFGAITTHEDIVEHLPPGATLLASNPTICRRASGIPVWRWDRRCSTTSFAWPPVDTAAARRLGCAALSV